MGKDGGIERSTNPQVLEYLREVARLKEKAQQHVSKRDATSDRNNITTTPSAKPTACLVGIYRENDTLKLRLPRTPTPPGPDDCCQSGCTPCILESYQDELLAHKQVVAALQAEYTAQLKQYDGSVPKVTSDSSGTKSAVLDTQNRLSEDDRAGKPLLVSRFQPFVATQVDTINHNSIRVVCKPTIPLDLASNQSLLIHAGYHVFLRVKEGDKFISRPFTPISVSSHAKDLEFLIKIYPDHPFSNHMRSLTVNDSLLIRGPIHSGFRGRLEEATSLVMLAAGSGITPMYQYLQTIFNTPSLQHLQVCLVHCNRTLSDIWLRDTLENLAQLHPQFTLHHVLSHEQLSVPTNDNGVIHTATYHLPRRRLDAPLLQSIFRSLRQPITQTTLPIPDLIGSTLAIVHHHPVAFVCGTLSFNESAKVMLLDMGIPEHNIHVFQ